MKDQEDFGDPDALSGLYESATLSSSDNNIRIPALFGEGT